MDRYPGKIWKMILDKTPTEIIKELAITVHQFFQQKDTSEQALWPPLYVMADQGDVNLCKVVIDKTGNCVNETLPALIITSEKGHTEVCNFFIESGILNECALHSAARSGHLEVCQLISDNLTDKNPADLENG